MPFTTAEQQLLHSSLFSVLNQLDTSHESEKCCLNGEEWYNKLETDCISMFLSCQKNFHVVCLSEVCAKKTIGCFCEMNEFCARFNSLVDVKRATKETTETFGISRDVSQLLESRVRACGGEKGNKSHSPLNSRAWHTVKEMKYISVVMRCHIFWCLAEWNDESSKFILLWNNAVEGSTTINDKLTIVDWQLWQYYFNISNKQQQRERWNGEEAEKWQNMKTLNARPSHFWYWFVASFSAKGCFLIANIFVIFPSIIIADACEITLHMLAHIWSMTTSSELKWMSAATRKSLVPL